MVRRQAPLLAAALVAGASGEFVRPPASEQKHPKLRLARADALNVTYRGLAWNSSEAELPNFALSLDAIFEPPLNEAQFRALQEVYSGWSATKSSVDFSPGEAFTLLDMLPWPMQALSGMHFHVQYHNYSLPSFVQGKESRQTTQSAALAANCWGTAWGFYEAASRPTKQLTLSLASSQVAWVAFTNERDFAFLQSSKQDERLLTDAEFRNARLQPGDAVLIWHDNGAGQGLWLDHVAIFLDEDLYYERAGSGDHVPFRLNTWEGLAMDWMPKVFHYDWRRRSREVAPAAVTMGLQQMASDPDFGLFTELKPEVAGAFSMTPDYNASAAPKHVVSNTYCWQVTLPPHQTDKRGRAQLHESVFRKEDLEIKIPEEIYREREIFLV